MKKFLLKTLLWLLSIVVLHLFLGSYADGNTDDNYRHFTAKALNLIMGDSRGSQAVVPSVLHNRLDKNFDNFSLNIGQSPYGEIYLKALQRKLAKETQDGHFILTVDPWNLSLDKSVIKLENFPEVGSPLDNMFLYNIHPNYEYLLKNYTRSWFKIYDESERRSRRSNTYLHKDGWLEVTVPMHQDSVAKRTELKVKDYANFMKHQRISEERIASFEKIISFLKNHGQVYIVRIPASSSIMKIEDRYWPGFTDRMKLISLKHQISYFDFSKNFGAYDYTDGNHMYKKSGKIFTAQIADSIRRVGRSGQ